MQKHKDIGCWVLLAMLAALLIPWLGETLFNTKGEPREAIVAVSMLQSGNWVLPVSYGADIPYKPPFLAWLIAIASWALNGGVVNEFTSRLPSALAAIAMVMAGYRWCRRYARPGIAMLMAVVTITSFEVYRAAVACRVDMLLTACMVCALYCMYAWRERPGMQPWRLLAIALLLCGAVFTKGPVGSLLPCLCMGIYCLLRGDNFFKTVGWLSAVCAASFALPAWWYAEAYKLGGQEFLDLAWEENIGRLTGTMGYESHLNPWPFNIATILAGMLPWTLLAIAAAIWAVPAAKRWLKNAKGGRLSATLSPITSTPLTRAWQGLRGISAPSLFCLTVSLVTFIFYCLPASKRSVYLLPMYPFMAYGIALIIVKIRDTRLLRGFNWAFIILALVAPVAACAMQWVSPAPMPIQPMPSWRYPIALLPTAYAIYWLIRGRKWSANAASPMVAVILLIYLALGAAFMPMVLNAKSDKPYAHAVRQASAPVYTIISNDPLLRYYTLNFYLDDALRQMPADGGVDHPRFALLASPADAALFAQEHPQYSIESSSPLTTRSCDTRSPLSLTIFAAPGS